MPLVRFVTVNQFFSISLKYSPVKENFINYPGYFKLHNFDNDHLIINSVKWVPGNKGISNPKMVLSLQAKKPGITYINYTVQPLSYVEEYKDFQVAINIDESKNGFIGSII